MGGQRAEKVGKGWTETLSPRILPLLPVSQSLLFDAFISWSTYFSTQPVKRVESQNSLTHWEEPLHSEEIAFQLPGKAGPQRCGWCLSGLQYMLDNPNLFLWRFQTVFSFVAQGKGRVKTHSLCLWGFTVKYSESRMTQLHLFYFLVTRETRRKNLQRCFHAIKRKNPHSL